MASAAPQVQYRDEFIAGFAQRQSLLKDTTTKEYVIKGNTATFMVAATTGTASTRGVNGLIPVSENSNTQVSATLVEKHDLREMTDFNVFQSQSDQRAIMQMNTMSIINRDIDLAILAALAAGTLDTGATAAPANATMIAKARAGLQNNGVPFDGQIFAAISPSFHEYLLELPSFSSADYVNVKPHVNFQGMNASDAVKSGHGWIEWGGVKWIVTSLLTGIGTSDETCIMWHRSAIGHAVNKAGMESLIGYEEKQDMSWSRTSLYHGAKLLQNTGVVLIHHDGSAHTVS